MLKQNNDEANNQNDQINSNIKMDHIKQIEERLLEPSAYDNCCKIIKFD